MKKVYIEDVVSDEEFYDALVGCCKRIQSTQEPTFQWLNLRKSFSSLEWQIIRTLGPIIQIKLSPGTKALPGMETVTSRPEYYFGLKGYEDSGYFGLSYESMTKSVLFVDSDDEHRTLFESIFDLACSELKRPRVIVTHVDKVMRGAAHEQEKPSGYGPHPGTLDLVIKAVREYCDGKSWEDARKAAGDIDPKTIDKHLEEILEQFQEAEREKALKLLQTTRKNKYLGKFRKV